MSEVCIYEVDVDAADESMVGVTYDVYLIGTGEDTEDEGAAASAAQEIFEETYGRDGDVQDVRYVGGTPERLGVFSVHEQRR